MQCALQIVQRWLQNLKLCGQDIPPSNEVKYLGLTLDTKLFYKSHVKNTIANEIRGLIGLQEYDGGMLGTETPLHTKVIVLIVTYLMDKRK